MNSEDEGQRTLIDEVVTLRNMSQLRSHVLRLAREAGLPADRADGFAVAVNEAVTNAIEHADGNGELAVVQDDQRRLIAEISDTGPGLSCSVTFTRPSPDVEGGRGLWLADKLTDHLEIRGTDRGTTVRLEMSLKDT